CEASFLGHNGAVTCFEAVDGVLLSGSADGLVREWDLNTGLLRLRFDLTWSARSLARLDSSDSLRVGTQSGDGGFIGALQFVGPALATGTADGFIRLYDRRSSQPVRSIASHSMPISSLRFNDRYIVSGSLDSSAAIWDLRALKLVQRIKFPSKVTSVSLLPSAPSNSFWFSASSSAFFNFSLLNSEFKAFDSLTGDLKLRMQNMIYDELDISKNPILLDYDHNSQKQNYFTKSHVSRLKYLDSDTLLTASETGSACIWSL
ncbi:Mitochondrial division protein 1, partial [Zancudomyces culisetae]